MKRYNILQALIYAFFSRSLYRDIGQNWKGLNLRLLLLVLAIAMAPMAYRSHIHAREFINTQLPNIVDQMPIVTVEHGIVSMDKKAPYFINDVRTGRVFIIIDPSGTVESLEGTSANILLTKNQVFVRRTPNETRIYTLGKNDNFRFGPKDVEGVLIKAKYWAGLVLYLFSILFMFIYRFIQALIYGALGLLMAKMLKASLTYAATIRIAITAVIPVIAILSVLQWLHMRVPYEGLLAFLLAMFYLFYGIYANSKLQRT